MDDALRPDVHKAARRHLAVIGHAERGGAVKVLLVIEQADHQPVGQYHARRVFVRAEHPERMPGFEHQRLLPRELLHVLLDQKILHPILADLTRFAVGHQLIGVERHVKIQIVVDHHLERAPLEAFALIFVHRPAPQPPRRTEAIAVDAAARAQLVQKLGRELLMERGRDVAERVFEREPFIRGGKTAHAARRAADPRHKIGIRGKLGKMQHAVRHTLRLLIAARADRPARRPLWFLHAPARSSRRRPPEAPGRPAACPPAPAPAYRPPDAPGSAPPF